LRRLESYGFFFGQRLIRLCIKIIVIVHHAGNSTQMSPSRTHTKFPNQGWTNLFLTRTANEHYAANLRGVNAQLRAQSCSSNQNTGTWVSTV
jgi:hypothetical protein